MEITQEVHDFMQHHLDGLACDMERNRPAIWVKDGRCCGSGAQHCSISLLHSGSHVAGMGGLNVLFTIPPALEIKVQWKY